MVSGRNVDWISGSAVEEPTSAVVSGNVANGTSGDEVGGITVTVDSGKVISGVDTAVVDDVVHDGPISIISSSDNRLIVVISGSVITIGVVSSIITIASVVVVTLVVVFWPLAGVKMDDEVVVDGNSPSSFQGKIVRFRKLASLNGHMKRIFEQISTSSNSQTRRHREPSNLIKSPQPLNLASDKL